MTALLLLLACGQSPPPPSAGVDEAKLAYITPPSLPEPYGIWVGGDLHVGQAYYRGTPDPQWDTLTEYLAAYDASGASSAIVTGDALGYAGMGDAEDPDRAYWDPAAPIPMSKELDLFGTSRDAWAGEWASIYWILGNHDAQPHDPRASSPWGDGQVGAWLDATRQLSSTRVVPIQNSDRHTVANYYVDWKVGGQLWRFLFLSDYNGDDISRGGRCGSQQWASTVGHRASRCSGHGYPAGAIEPAAYGWLVQRLDDASAADVPVVVVSHQGPPSSTIGTWPGEAHVDTCGYGTRFNGSQAHPGGGNRPDLTPAVLAAWDAYSGALVGRGMGPEPSWIDDLLDSYGSDNPVRLWLASHQHLQAPDQSWAGHGTSASIGPAAAPTLVLSVGSFQRVPTGSRPMGVLLTLTSSSLAAERWATGPVHEAVPCQDPAIEPTVYPAPFVGLTSDVVYP